jgi:hypothetical protein
MNKQQQLILNRLESLLHSATTDKRCKEVREQIEAYKKHIEPKTEKPQPPWERVCEP